MQFCIYAQLKAQWVQRREMLRSSIELMMARSSKSMEDFQREEDKLKRINESLEARARREAEEQRQRDVCALMAAEEKRCRDFYKAELLVNLGERRMMALEERLMRMYLLMLRRQEEVKAKLLPGEKSPPPMTRNEMRRLELKKKEAERIREEKEGALMIAEDEASAKMRGYYKVLEQRQKLMEEGQMVMDDGDDDDDDESVELDPEEDVEVIPNIPPKPKEVTQEEQEAMLLVGGVLDPCRCDCIQPRIQSKCQMEGPL
jgi:hypothetical protein